MPQYLRFHNWDFLPPEKCPICKNLIGINEYVSPNVIEENKNVEIIFRCNNLKCSKFFIGYYNVDNTTNMLHLRGTHPENNISFAEHISVISESFVRIYKEAYTAENLGLEDSAGTSYRKAFEFLIKDYALLKSGDEHKEKIVIMTANQVINTYFQNPILKDISKRALWLGNDAVHYFRKWDNKSIEDLKKVIQISLHYIEMEYLANKYIEEMPEDKKGESTSTTKE